MKKLSLLLLAFPLLCVAAAPGPQVFFGVWFGMPQKEMYQAIADYYPLIEKAEHQRRGLNVSDVLKHFVSELPKQPITLTAKEAAYPAPMFSKSKPVLTEFGFENGASADLNASHQTWELFRRIGDAKWTRTSEPAPFPPPVPLPIKAPVFVVTDTWEAVGGVRISLAVSSMVVNANGSTETLVRFGATPPEAR